MKLHSSKLLQRIVIILHWRAVRSRDDHMLHFSLRISKLGLSILLKSIALLPSRFRVFARKSRTSPGPRHTLDKNGSFKWSVGNRIPSRAIRFELITHIYIYMGLWWPPAATYMRPGAPPQSRRYVSPVPGRCLRWSPTPPGPRWPPALKTHII